MDWSALGVFAGALIVTAGSPGPSVAALVSRVITNGWRDIAPFLIAMWLGEIAWLLAALAGLSALATHFEAAFTVLKWCGVAYLVWLAIEMWREPVSDTTEPLPRRRSRWSMFAAGLAVTLGNPKIMVFYVALLPSLIDLTSTSVSHWVILVILTLTILASIDLAWTLAAERARIILRSPSARRLANRIGALTIGAAAATIATRS
ncbi:MAG: LysE family translocator [Pseudomonadota bacterium]